MHHKATEANMLKGFRSPIACSRLVVPWSVGCSNSTESAANRSLVQLRRRSTLIVLLTVVGLLAYRPALSSTEYFGLIPQIGPDDRWITETTITGPNQCGWAP